MWGLIFLRRRLLAHVRFPVNMSRRFVAWRASCDEVAAILVSKPYRFAQHAGTPALVYPLDELDG